MAERKIYVAKIRGEYITQAGHDRILKGYKATFKLPSADAPLSVIRGKLLMPFLRKLDVNAIAPYSWHMEEIAPMDGNFDPDDVPVIFQTFAQLTIYVKRHRLAVPVAEYSDLELCRQHVILAKTDPESYKQVYAAYSSTANFDKELELLNQNFDNIGSSLDVVEVDPNTGIPTPKRPLPTVKTKPSLSDDEVLLA